MSLTSPSPCFSKVCVCKKILLKMNQALSMSLATPGWRIDPGRFLGQVMEMKDRQRSPLQISLLQLVLSCRSCQNQQEPGGGQHSLDFKGGAGRNLRIRNALSGQYQTERANHSVALLSVHLETYSKFLLFSWLLFQKHLSSLFSFFSSCYTLPRPFFPFSGFSNKLLVTWG